MVAVILHENHPLLFWGKWRESINGSTLDLVSSIRKVPTFLSSLLFGILNLIFVIQFLFQRNFLYCFVTVENCWGYFVLLINLVPVFFLTFHYVPHFCSFSASLTKEENWYLICSQCCSWRCMWAGHRWWSLLRHSVGSICNSWGERCFNWRAGTISCLLAFCFCLSLQNCICNITSWILSKFLSEWLGLGEGGTSCTYDSCFTRRDKKGKWTYVIFSILLPSPSLPPSWWLCESRYLDCKSLILFLWF